MAKKNAGKNRARYSNLDQHHRAGKTLTPPLRKIGNVTLSSWYNERLPNVLWAALLVSSLSREEALRQFRAVAKAAEVLGEGVVDGIDHTVLRDLRADHFDALFSSVLNNSDARSALSPLLFFENLPDRAHWARWLAKGAEGDDGGRLARAIAVTFDHQSQESTDCRWLRVLVLVVTGRMKFAPTLRQRLEEILGYPDLGDQRSVRPSIRASEISLDNMRGKNNAWPDAFWKECWERTECIPLKSERYKDAGLPAVGAEVMSIYADAGVHAFENEAGTAIDPRFDAVFGLVMNCLAMAAPILRSGGHARAEGRIILRVMVESYITLGYLLRKDNPSTWRKYREYGQGQTKLAFLKFDKLDDAELPNFISKEELERFSNEDIWQEYTNIELGHWAGSDLRSMSMEAGVKDIYDKYYDWPSAYVHASWPAAREVVFDQCLNPLHRFHRIVAPPNFNLGSVAQDMVKLINLHLDALNRAYPTFKRRMKLVASEKTVPDSP